MKKEILLVSVFLIAVLVSVSAVSAANLTVGTGGTYSNIQDAYDDANDGDTIIIANGLYTGDDNRGIDISKNLNITGQTQNGTIIDAEHQNYIFYVENGYTVNFSKLTLRNGEGDSDGGAIHNDGNVTATGCTFVSNHADSNGGAIYTNGKMTVTGCTFTGNDAYYSGGAIYNDDGNLTVSNCNFTDNEVYDSDGGAIRNYGTCTVTGSTFTDNSAAYCCGGGAINNEEIMTITGCTFTGNYDDYAGGAVYNDDTMTITSCTFTCNNAEYYGGAIFNEYGDSILNITDCTFVNNGDDYTEYGGAIYINSGTCNVNNCTFINNTADYDGGAISNDGITTVTGSTFKGNEAEYGGAIYACCGNMILTGCIFTNNTADEGGAIYFSDETLNITGCNFNKNMAESYGGAIYIEGGGEGNYAVNAKYSRFVGNMVGTTAQDIYLAGFGTAVDFRYNWWGSNDGPAAGRIAQVEGTPDNETYVPWLVMNINVDPSTIYAGATSKVTANVYTDSEGIDHSGYVAQFFSGPEVTFTTNLGNVGSKSVTVDWILGTATAILRGDEGPGIAILTATDADQTGATNVTILKSPEVNAASTIGMQNTGVPVNYLILAVLMVLGGFLLPRRK